MVNKVSSLFLPIIGGADAPGPAAGSGVDVVRHALKLREVRTQQHGDDLGLPAILKESAKMKRKAESSSNPVRPSKRFGQHFLHDRNIIGKIIAAFDPSPDECVVEIGPGTGALTSMLVERAGTVIAIEFDRKLIEPLREQFAERDNFRLVEADALEADICKEIVPANSARIVANLPYNISTAILQRLIDGVHTRDGFDAKGSG